MERSMTNTYTRKNKKDCNTETISSMVTPDVFNAVGRVAYNLGISKSQYIRELILEDIQLYDGLFSEEMDHEFYQ